MKMMTSDDDLQMDETQVACFSIISYVGEAKSCYMEALRAARKEEFAEARVLVEKGLAHFAEGHLVHGTLISREAATGDVPTSLLLMHAETQLMDAESCKTYTVEFIELREELARLRRDAMAIQRYSGN